MGGFDNFLSTRAGIGGLFDDSEDKAIENYLKSQQAYENLAVPNIQAENFTPEETQYQQINEDPQFKQMQIQQLNKMGVLADTGYSDADNAGFQQATGQANIAARQNRDAVLKNAEARGVANGGMQYALQEQGNQDAMNRAHQQSLQQASDSARQRALYNQSYGAQLGDVRNQDYRSAQDNAAITNQFNQLNTQNRNTANLGNINRRQDVTQQNYQNQLSKLAGQSGANTQAGNAYSAQNASRASQRKQDMDTFMSGMKMMGGGA